MKKILFSLMAILLAVGLVGAGTFAYFSDTEISEDNTFQAGTLDLKVDGKDDPNIVPFIIENMKPGDTQTHVLTLKNAGSIPGKLSFKFSSITNDDNDLTEPEKEFDSTGGDGEGELGEHLRITIRIGNYYPTGPFSLNSRGGTEYLTSVILGQDETVDISFTLTLPIGTGNIVQSDSVEFDLIFHLKQ